MNGGCSITALTPAIGAEVHGLDLASDLDPEVFDRVHEAFLEHHVLVFRGQSLSREQHKAVGRRFGELHVHPSRRRAGFEGDPEVFPVRADHDTVLNNGGLWHADVTCDEVPPLGSLLLLTEAPASGGDTLFANMHLALETLSAPMQRLLIELDAVHDQRQDVANYRIDVPPEVELPRSTHPVVVAHPDTGRPLLFVNRAFTTHIEGVTPAESQALLDLLFDHIAGGVGFQCRVRWEPGTMVLWDNRCTQHFAVWDYRPQRRCGERVTISGTTPPRRP